AGRRSVEAPEQVTHRHADRRDDPIVGVVGFEIEAEHRRAGHAAQPALAAGELGPAVADGEQERGQRQREQRKINAAPPQYQRSGEKRGRRNKENREQERENDLAGKPIALAQGGGVGAESEPCAVAERDEPGIADQHIESHTGNGEHDDIDRGAQRQAGDIEGERQHRERERRNQKRGVFVAHAGYSNFWMRSPKRPRGRTSSTSAISRYIEPSPQDGLKSMVTPRTTPTSRAAAITPQNKPRPPITTTPNAAAPLPTPSAE